MSSYVTFVNKSAYPAVSVYYDGFPIDDMILKNASSEEYAVESGTVGFSVRENHNKEFLNLWLSLYPMRSYKLIIKNHRAYLK